MTAQPNYAERRGVHSDTSRSEPPETSDHVAVEPEGAPFDETAWLEPEVEHRPVGAGGRAVLGWALGLLAGFWVAYTAWSAGQALRSEPLNSPALAQWVAIAAGPLALLGLIWLMFGRTRRKEAEQFTRSVVAMRTEARALEDVLASLSRQIDHNHTSLGRMAGDLMGLGDEAATRIGAISAEFGARSTELVRHGAALDRAAESARTDIGVLLGDLPEAEERALRLAETLRSTGQSSLEQGAAFQASVEALTARTGEADLAISEASQRLVDHLTRVEQAGVSAAARVTEAGDVTNAGIDALLNRTAESLSGIRSGIDAQAASVSALLEQAQAGLGRAGIEASQALGQRLDSASGALDGLTARIAEQERSSQRLMASLDTGLAALDERFGRLAEQGDQRAQRISGLVRGLRGDLDAFGSDTAAQDQALLALTDRTAALRDGVSTLSIAVAQELGGAFVEAEAGAERLLSATQDVRPSIDWMRDAAAQTAERLIAGQQAVEASEQKLGAMLAAVDGGVSSAQQRIGDLTQAIALANDDAARLSNETGPALISALVQVREASALAAERARTAIAAIIPASATELGDATRAALERVVRETVAERLAEVDRVATRAVETAREATDRLTQQMLSIGQSAVALEAHIEQSRAAERKDDGEDFTRRVSLLMDSMHSASIDVQKILSDEVDEKAWGAYLKGNRGVFTRRAVRLIGGTETRAIAAHYESDPEFKESVNRYVHDFEAMLRRVLAERDGGMIAVTLMSSDMGKLYGALAQGVERRR
ncbi:MAG TPA: hypothetical protein VNI79_03615 [Sphingomicrobium sp.]|nr:hypothetical protein [Sphingomicrobium sp.]